MSLPAQGDVDADTPSRLDRGGTPVKKTSDKFNPTPSKLTSN